MKHCLCILIVFCCFHGVRAQASAEQAADSLYRLAQGAPDDSVKIERLLDLSFFWCDRDTAKAFHYIDESRKLMGNKPTDYQQGLLHHFTANIIYNHDIERAKSEYMLAEKYLARYRFPRAYFYRSKVWNNYGTLLQRQDSANLFMGIIVDRALPYARLAGDSTAVGNHLQNIALLLSNVQDYEKAESYFKQALNTLSTATATSEDWLTVFVNAAKNAILGENLGRARGYLDSAAAVYHAIPYTTYASFYYRTEGQYYRHIREKEKALEMFRKGIARAESLRDAYSLRDIYFEMYAMYRDFGEYGNAKKYLLISNQYDPVQSTHNRLLHLREMANVEFKLGNFRAAYEQMEAYALGKDTFQQNNMALKIIDLEKQYESIGKENEILKLKDINQQQQMNIDRSRFWLVLLGAGLSIALIIAFFSWKLAKSNHNTLVQNELLHQEELKTLRQQEQLHRYQSILQGQEEERNRIARDLHDGLGGLLAGVKLRLSAIATRDREKNSTVSTEVNAVIGELDHAVDELRRVSRNMMPEALLYMGLESALADLCNYMDTPATAVKFQGIGLRSSYPKPVLIGVYRMVQELLNNAIKHAHATQIIVQCSDSDGCLFLTVEDDGVGFNIQLLVAKGLGLKNIEDRVALLQGRMEIDSKPGEGTTVNIEIPV
ncbi:sensor histidine kinase [Parapedobacter lycopersici]|uniref:tetratricopeptide repeat-containing sensor histidine kinase n=1 Tax=Parapedobacter lycopersici TaxID=1864939 RepID=UPI003341372E